MLMNYDYKIRYGIKIKLQMLFADYHVVSNRNLGSKWLVLIDDKSKFAVVKDMKNNTSVAGLVNVLEDIFTSYGFCEYIVYDNGPPFSSQELSEYFLSKQSALSVHSKKQ